MQTLKSAQTRREAEQAEAIIRTDLFRQVYGRAEETEKKDSHFEQFVVDHFLPYSEANKKTFYDDVIVCRILVQFFKGRTLRSITPALVEEFKRKRLATPLKRQKDRVESIGLLIRRVSGQNASAPRNRRNRQGRASRQQSIERCACYRKSSLWLLMQRCSTTIPVAG